LAARLPEPYGLMVIVTTFASLRWGEVTALRRGDVDAEAGIVRVQSAFTRPYSGKVQRGAPKSRAGDRVLVVPRPVAELLAARLESDAVGESPDALIFTGDRGGPLQRSNFNKRVSWKENVAAIGAPGCTSTIFGTRATRSRR
jgi:integrase